MIKFLDEMDPWENPVVEFDFSADLASVDGTPVITITPGGIGLLDGAPQIVGASVLQRIKPDIALDKTNYTMICKASGGVERRVRAAILPVRKAG